MPLPFILPNGRPMKERIGVFGLPKIGKTHLFFTIARWHQQLGSDARFYGINTDTSWEILYSNPEFMDLENIEWEDAGNYQEFYLAIKKYNDLLRDPDPANNFPGDWLCTDLQDNLWDYVQDEYTRMRAKEEDIDMDNLGELWTESGNTKSYPIGGWDWQTPNALYRTVANNYILRGRGHRFIISGQTDVLEPSANMKEDELAKKTREMFAHLGVKPKGQKDDPFRWHTLLNITSRGEKQQAIATAGERSGRREWMGRRMSKGNSVKPVALEDFFMDYLIGIAGWSM